MTEFVPSSTRLFLIILLLSLLTDYVDAPEAISPFLRSHHYYHHQHRHQPAALHRARDNYTRGIDKIIIIHM
jgi:hypothetical protein